MSKKIALIITIILIAGLLFPVVVYGQAPAPQPRKTPPNRGCDACHFKVSPQRDFSLFGEAKRAMKDHPKKDSKGKLMNEKTKVETCMECHKAGRVDDKGEKTKLTLRDIVHPSHEFSPIFLEEFQGNCFSCHTLDNQGNWKVIAKKLKTNVKGVQEKTPVPGTLKKADWVGAAKNIIYLWIISIAALVLAVIALIVAAMKRS